MNRAVRYALGERAPRLAQRIPILIDMHQQVISATFAKDLGIFKTRDALSAAVPVGDAALYINEIDSVVQIVQYAFVEVMLG